MFRLRNEKDVLHSGVNFHLSCLRTLCENNTETATWKTLNVTEIRRGDFRLETYPSSNRNATVTSEPNNPVYPVFGMISPYYMQNKIVIESRATRNNSTNCPSRN